MVLEMHHSFSKNVEACVRAHRWEIRFNYICNKKKTHNQNSFKVVARRLKKNHITCKNMRNFGRDHWMFEESVAVFFISDAIPSR